MNAFENIVDGIYVAATQPERWPEVLHDIGVCVDAPVVMFALLNMQGEKWAGWCISPETPDSMHDYMRSGIHQKSQTTPRLLQANHAGFLTALDVLSEEEFIADPLMTEWGSPEGMYHAAASAIQIPTGDMIVVHAQRRIGAPEFHKKEIAQLDGFRPHLARAGLLAARWRLERLRAAAEALALLGLPAAVLDSSGRVLTANSLMQTTVKWVSWLPGDRLALRDAAANALLLRAIAELKYSRASAVRSIPVRTDADADAAVVHVIPISGHTSELFNGGFEMVVITPICAPDVPTGAMLQGLFDLTPAEVRVARGIAAGLKLSQVATRNGVAFETIRAQLKAIFDKTGTRRQAELTAMLAALPKPPPGERS